MQTQQLLKIAKWTALFSFLVGTCIFLFYYVASDSNLLFIGFTYIIVAGIFNLIILLLLLYRAFVDKQSRNKILRFSVFMLLNIPIVFFYSWLTMQLMDTMRITFVNPTSTQVTNINITGCEEKYISKLNPRESKTVWVHIPKDCAIYINYTLNQQNKMESVIGYCTQGNGTKMIYRIGKDKSFDKNL